MHFSRKIKCISTSLLAVLLIIVSVKYEPVKAYDFAGNEEKWTNYCSGIISDPQKQADCKAYSDYITKSVNDERNNANNITASIGSVKEDLSNLREVSQDYKNKIADVTNEIEVVKKSIATMDANVAKLADQIEESKAKISARKDVINKRMRHMQPNLNTNQFLNYIMGSEDLVDMIQRSKSVESFTKNDKEQIRLYNKEKAKLEEQQNEQKRIKATLDVQKKNLESKQNDLAALKAANDKMIAENEVKVRAMEAKRNEANSRIANFESHTPNFEVGIKMFEQNNGGGGVNGAPASNVAGSSGLIKPVNAPMVCGVGGYAGHLGSDYAGPVGTPIVAPANGIIVFARNNHANNDGYLGNFNEPMGPPIGGGNVIRMICSANGQTYAINFFHCKQEMPAISLMSQNGGYVSQGTVIGYLGNTGNTSGPHTHIELYKLNQSVPEAVNTFRSTHDFTSGCGWSNPFGSSSYAQRVEPSNYF